VYKDPINKIKVNSLKVISWNLLHKSGALAEEISRIIDVEKPDVFLMQEATEAIDSLPAIVGGHYQRQEWPKKRHGLAIWSAIEVPIARPVTLPFSKIPGSFPPRRAQVVDIDDVTLANVHLSHGQVLNRKQLQTLANKTEGPTAIMGDYNAIGPVKLKRFKDVGPRHVTHKAQRIVPFRLDRCMVREMFCKEARTLMRGRSDHKPILVELTRHGNS